MFRFAASSTPSTLTQTVIRLGAVAAACSALTWSLSGCGGGSRAKEYVPDSVVSFGDENSAMETFSSTALDPSGSTAKTVDGLIYTVNPLVFGSDLTAYTYCTDTTANTLCSTPITDVTGFVATASHPYYFAAQNTTGTNILTMVSTGNGTYSSVSQALKQTYDIVYRCESSYLWNQYVAHNFGKGFKSSCSRDADGAKTYATYQATVDDLGAQVNAHRAELHDGVLVTIMIGQKDILGVYQDVTDTPAHESTAISTLDARGRAAAAIVQSVLNTGAKVVLALTPDLGESPKAAALDGTGKDRLKAYTTAFNNGLKFGMGSTAAQDGRHFALVESDLFTNPITRSGSYVHNTAVCNLSGSFTRPDGTTVQNADADFNDRVKYCNSSTLVTNGNAYTYIWADLTHYAPGGHALIGSLAATRVANQF